MSRASLIRSLVLLVLIIPPTDALASWSVGVGGGFTDGYSYHTYSFGSAGLKGGSYPSIVASRGLGQRVSFQLESSYLRFGDSYQSAQFLPVGLGVRFLPVVNPEVRGKPYVQLSPALIVARLSQRNTTYMIRATTVEQSFTEVLPGAIAGAGIAGPIAGKLHLDLGLRYLFSMKVKDPQHIIAGGELKGLSQTSITTALAFTL